MKQLDKLKAEYNLQEEKRKIQNRWNDVGRIWYQFTSKNGYNDVALQPRPVDLAVYEPLKTAIFISHEKELNEQELSQAVMNRVSEEWTKARDELVISLLPDNIAAPMKANSRLRPLAVLFFRGVARGSHPVDLHQFCGWRSSRHVYKPVGEPEHFDIISSIDDLWTSNPWLWDSDRYRFDPEACAIAQEVMAFVGMDSMSSSIAEMENFKFRCLRCRGSRQAFMRLSVAVQHEVKYHSTPSVPVENKWSWVEGVEEDG